MQDLTLLPLHEILLHNGYRLNRDKSSVRNPVLQNENETLVINKIGDNYLYFNTDGSNDRGNIINFCKNRKVDVKTLIYNYENGEISEVNIPKYFSNEQLQRKHNDEYNNFKSYNPDKSQFFINRGLYDCTIEPYVDSFKQDEFGNMCFPSYKLVEARIKDKTISNITMCGYVQRLSFPLYKDKEGNLRDKPLKNVNRGAKGLEILNINKDSTQIKQIVFGESIIDLLSFIQIYKENYNPNETMLVSTAGNFTTEGVKPILNELFNKCSQARVITCFDNDENGLKFTKFIQDLTLEKTKKGISTYKPFAKDVNDDLKLRQITQLKTLNNKSFTEFLEIQLVNYQRTSDTSKRRNILEKIRKINTFKPLKADYKERFNEIHKHKAIKKL